MTKKTAASRATILMAALTLSACLFDWDKLDPALGSGGGSGDGGSAGAGASGTGGGTGACSNGETIVCYDGPDGTKDVGACKEGASTCQGGVFGPCEGAIKPIAEDCNTPADDDCDGEANEVDEGCTCTPGELRACYDGPMGTAGVGACVAGEKMCLPSATDFTVCFGQIVPRFEDCHTAADDDCDGSVNEDCPIASAGWEAGNHAVGAGISLDSDGDVVMAGWVDGDITIGGTTLLGNGDYDLVVVKTTTAGVVQDVSRWGDAAGQYPASVATDGAGNFYVGGRFDGVLGFGVDTLTSAGNGDAFLVKFDDNGDPIWARSFGDTGSQAITDVAADAAGNVLMTGWFEGGIDLDVVQGVSNVRDGFVAKLNPGGTVVWAKVFGGPDSDEGLSVAFNGTDVIVGGYFDDEISFGGPIVFDLGDLEGFVAKLDANGVEQWITPLGPDNDQIVQDVAAGPGGVTYAVGGFDGHIDLGSGLVVSAGSADAFVVALSANGTPTWSKTYGNTQFQSGWTVSVDPSDNLWAGISFEEGVDFGGGEMLSYGDNDIAMVKLDSSGAYVQSTRMGGFDNESINGSVVDSLGNLYMIGHAEGDVDFAQGWVDCDGGWWTAVLAP